MLVNCLFAHFHSSRISTGLRVQDSIDFIVCHALFHVIDNRLDQILLTPVCMMTSRFNRKKTKPQKLFLVTSCTLELTEWYIHSIFLQLFAARAFHACVPRKCNFIMDINILETGNASLVELLSACLIAALDETVFGTWHSSRGRAFGAIIGESLV